MAPVFLLTGIGSFLSVLVNRLGRAVDRARNIKAMNTGQDELHFDELGLIIARVAWMRFSIGLLFIFAGLCVSLLIALIFIGVATEISFHNFVLMTFITSMFALIFGLLCFLKEIITCHRLDIHTK